LDQNSEEEEEIKEALKEDDIDVEDAVRLLLLLQAGSPSKTRLVDG
jgi:hypothetical protein